MIWHGRLVKNPLGLLQGHTIEGLQGHCLSMISQGKAFASFFMLSRIDTIMEAIYFCVVEIRS